MNAPTILDDDVLLRATDLSVHFGGVPSPNLLAAGEVMAGNVLGQGYTAGVGMTIGTVFGRIAGAQALTALAPRGSAQAPVRQGSRETADV